MVTKKKAPAKTKEYKYAVASYDGFGSPTAQKGFYTITDANTYFEKIQNKNLDPNTQSTVVLLKNEGKNRWEEIKSVQVARLSWR
jgi:hypothetical protein